MMSVGSPHHAPRTSTAWHSSRLCATRALLSIHNQHHAPWFGTLVVCVVLELTRRHFYSPHARPLLPLLPATSFVSVVCPYVSVRVRTCPLPCLYDVRSMSGYCPVTVRLLSGLLPADVQMDRTRSNRPPLEITFHVTNKQV